jgi:hypothetical protein
LPQGHAWLMRGLARRRPPAAPHHKVRRTTSSCPSSLPSSSWLASRSPPFPRESSGAPRQKSRRCRPDRRGAWLERASHSSKSFRGMRQTRPTRTAGMRDGSASSTAPSRRKMVVGWTRSRRATSSVVRNSSSEASRSRGWDVATAAPALCALRASRARTHFHCIDCNVKRRCSRRRIRRARSRSARFAG